MKLERMYLQNFRCFESLEIAFDERLTVIIAENGAGKTAILDAISIGFGRYLSKLPGVKGNSAKDSDLRVAKSERKEPLLMLSWTASIEGDKQLAWSGIRRRDASITTSVFKKWAESRPESVRQAAAYGLKPMTDYALGLLTADTEEQPYFLPVVAYYGTNRAIREEVKRRRNFKKNFTRFEALSGALEPDSRFRSAFEWFDAMEDMERREGQRLQDLSYKLPELQVVREAIERILAPGFTRPRTELRPLRFVLDRKLPDGSTQTLRVSQLSDGYRVMLGLTMDLARRLAQANSHGLPEDMQGQSLLDLPAIALIDEVDLHLHPSWQQRVLKDLMQTFRNTQFIVTTHSPQVLSTVKRENIRVIGTSVDGQTIASQPLAMTYGEPSGDVMHSVMFVDPQPPVAEKDDLQRLTELVDQGRYQDKVATDLMAQLLKTLGQLHPQLQRLQRSIQRQEALK